MITQEQVQELFHYDNGSLYWKSDRGLKTKSGSLAGYLDKKSGRMHIMIMKKMYKLYRVIFLYHHGYLPKYLDHKDTDKANNKIENLRPCTLSENGCNAKLSKANTSGVKGVCWHKGDKRWVAQLRVAGKNKRIGSFHTIPDAAKAVRIAREEFHGAFANHG